ncbi:MAG: hydroxymethylglutaryl-CoA lyase [Deltaproteobacteria bacterium]|nr:hydroxymethylglutaryl-CoA lyase [Deltaproteobacteria bacterium]
MMNIPTEVSIVEVGPRDGLQNIPEFLDTEKKIELIKLLVQSGLKRIEATSFVHPKAIPQFRDARDIIAGVVHLPGVRLRALVPNLIGSKNALASGVRELSFVFSASEAHNKSNVNRTREESVDELEKILGLKEAYPDMAVQVSLATVFGCPFEGEVKEEETLKYVTLVKELGVDTITLADTVGFGNPRQVRQIVRACLRQFPSITFGVHFHNTRGLGLANTLVCLEEGISLLDSSIGGLGGCPFAPGATGNISTEDLVFMLDGMGIQTGVRIEGLLEASCFLKENLRDIQITSHLFKAGLPSGERSICRTS